MHQLTKRENEIMRAVLEYKTTTRQLSVEFGVCECTIKRHLGHIYTKLGVKNLMQAAVKYYKEVKR